MLNNYSVAVYMHVQYMYKIYRKYGDYVIL